MNVSGSITVGYGVSGSASYSKSKVNADYASVNEQSGTFTGDDGYQINVKNHTDLKGGIITSTQNAENNGKNRFETGTLKFEDLANHAEYKGEAIGLGVSGSVKGDNPNGNSKIYTADKTGMSSTMGYGKESDKQHSTTFAGINTANITIRDEDKQKEITGRTAEEIKQAVKTDLTLENYAEHSGSLKNVFDKEKVQNEIDLQVKVTQEFGNNLKKLDRLQNERLDKLKAKKEAGEINEDEYNRQVEKIETQKLIANIVGAGLLSPADSLTGVAVSAVSPAVSHEIGQYFKGLAEENKRQGITEEAELTASQKTAHIAAHAILGAVTANANGGNALSGALSAGGAEAIAPVISSMLYKETNPENLTAEQKETISAVTQALGTLSGSVTGDSSLDAYVGGTVATNAVENNNTALPRQPRGNPVQSTANPYSRTTYNGYVKQVRKILRDENFNGLPSFRDFDPVTREGIITEAEVREMQRFTDFVIANQNRSNWTSRDFVYYFYNPSLIGRNITANNANASNALNRKLSSLEKAQEDAVRTEVLPDGRIRYYDRERPARTTGATRGNSIVTEYNPKNGNVRQWAASFDHFGNVNRVHPKSINGQTVNSQHYPPTQRELKK